ncbi:MAG: hypothetical protein CVU54_09700 [Deltaproteobacteria bacterium HGW-Deltaproteobacteria-12]|jgi:hypothetical protein|nr:MAG: hypothetical protein CVU54_09700 [Deltaproteobacteria bacterium HGW-Deltaproteobacteria-12]
MKTEQELRKMMKSKKYSGSIAERDPDFIREVEEGFKALYPDPEVKLQVDETKIPEAIRNERDNRTTQFKNITAALHEAKAHFAALGALTDKVERSGSLPEIRRHWLELEDSRQYLEILSGRLSEVSNLSGAANEKFNAALEKTHPCNGCKNSRQDRLGKLCGLGWEVGKQAIPLEDLKTCPDPKQGRD